MNKKVASSQNCVPVSVHIPYPTSEQNRSKTTPFVAAHTYMAYVREHSGMLRHGSEPNLHRI